MTNAELTLEIAIAATNALQKKETMFHVTEVDCGYANAVQIANQLNAIGLAAIVQQTPKTASPKTFVTVRKLRNLDGNFTDAMQQRLNDNTVTKGDWLIYANSTPLDSHIHRLELKLDKVKAASSENIKEELADLANIAMFAFIYAKSN